MKRKIKKLEKEIYRHRKICGPLQVLYKYSGQREAFVGGHNPHYLSTSNHLFFTQLIQEKNKLSPLRKVL